MHVDGQSDNYDNILAKLNKSAAPTSPTPPNQDTTTTTPSPPTGEAATALATGGAAAASQKPKENYEESTVDVSETDDSSVVGF